MSNAELQIQFKGARQRTQGWYELGLYVAWHVAALGRVPVDKPLPKLETMMAGLRKNKPKATKAQQKAIFRQTADRFGLKVKRVPRKKASG